MVLIWNALRWLFVGIFSYAIDRIAKRYGPALIALGFIITAIVAAVTAYLSLMFSMIDGLNKTIPQVVIDVWGWVMPGNAIPCLMLLLTAKGLSWFTKQGLKVLEVRSKAVS